MIWKDKNGFLDKIKDKERFGIFLDMGVGKTSLLLSLIDYKIFEQDIKKVLIITPKKVSLSTWQSEINKWDNFRYLSPFVQLVDGDEEERNSKLSKTSNFSIHIISSALTEWLVERKVRVGKNFKVIQNKLTPAYDLIIVDECSQFKSTKTHRFKALNKLAKKQLFLLSGTPFSNIVKEGKAYKKADEMFYVLKLLKIYENSITKFRDEHCFLAPYDEFNYRMKVEEYEKWTAEIDKVSIKKKLELAIEKKEITVYCKNDDVLFKKMKNDFLVNIENEGASISASNQAIMINKTLQLANGFMYDNSGEMKRINFFKFERLKKLLKEIKGNVIIFYNFKEDKELLKTLEGSRVLEKDADKDDWNNGKIPILILSPFSDKYGLNLQDGGYQIIWFGLIWSAESYSQANARLYRTGQLHDVYIYYLMAENSFDDYVYKKLILKTEVLDDFMKIIRG